MSPFQALFGYQPPNFLHIDLHPQQVNKVQKFLVERQRLSRILKDQLLLAQQRMKQFADSKRTEREFQAGDWVFMKLQPYRQLSMGA